MRKKILLLTAMLLSLPCFAQEIATRHLCTIDRRYPNDGDCYGDLFFQFHSQSQDPDGDSHGVTVAVFFWHDRLCVSFSVDGRAEVYAVDLL
jgi:hypothetical protein